MIRRRPLGGAMAPADRRAMLLDTGLRLAEDVGFVCLTADAVADAAGVSRPLLSAYWRPFREFKDDVMRLAVERGASPEVETARGAALVISQGLSLHHPVAEAAPFGVRRAAVAVLMGDA